uniref:Uncharacterized protein n=1 Tax=Melopsittacus undulatus TaxID=13146 RepID=A0A8V5FRB3_MELUD
LPSGVSTEPHSLVDKDVMWDSVKCFAQVQVDDDNCSTPVHHFCSSVIEDHQIGQAGFSPSKDCSGRTRGNELKLKLFQRLEEEKGISFSKSNFLSCFQTQINQSPNSRLPK